MVFETALVVVLLTGTALVASGLWRLAHLDLGFDARNVLAVELHLPPRWSGTANSLAFEHQLLDRVRQIHGVTVAAASSTLPFANGALTPIVLAPGSKDYCPTDVVAADEQYLPLLRVPVHEGRALEARDDGNLQVVVVNEALARRFPGGRALGRRIETAPGRSHEVVGIVGDITEVGQIRGQVIKLPGFSRLTLPAAYVPSGTSDGDPFRFLLLRTSVPVADIVTTVKREMRAIDQEATIRRFGMLDERVGAVGADKRFYALIGSVFGMIALVLCGIGLYAVLAHGVGQRMREVAVRIALGAGSGAVRWMVFREGLVLVAAGMLAGFGTALAGTRVLTSFLFEVSPTDPPTLAFVVALVVLVALTAMIVPTRRATRVDPADVLRAE